MAYPYQYYVPKTKTFGIGGYLVVEDFYSFTINLKSMNNK